MLPAAGPLTLPAACGCCNCILCGAHCVDVTVIGMALIPRTGCGSPGYASDVNGTLRIDAQGRGDFSSGDGCVTNQLRVFQDDVFASCYGASGHDTLQFRVTCIPGGACTAAVRLSFHTGTLSDPADYPCNWKYEWTAPITVAQAGCPDLDFTFPDDPAASEDGFGPVGSHTPAPAMPGARVRIRLPQPVTLRYTDFCPGYGPSPGPVMTAAPPTLSDAGDEPGPAGRKPLCLHVGPRTEFRPGCGGWNCEHACLAGHPVAVPGGVCQTCVDHAAD